MAGRRPARPLPLVLPILISVLGCLFFASCTRGKPAPEPRVSVEAADPRAQWYQLQDAAFVRIDGPGTASAVERLPWTVQSRVADMAFLGDELYCALNGSGLARLRFDPAGPPGFSYFADPLIFPHRTITTLVPREGGLAAHLYYNALLNTVAADRLAIRGISLVTFLADRQDYAFLIPPFQRKNPSWEAVGFVPVSEAEFLFEWKYTDLSETRFAYTRFFPSRRTEAPAARSQYIGALAVPIESLGASSPRRRFLEACLGEIRAASPDSTVLFTVRGKGTIRQTVKAEGPGTSVASVAVFEEKSVSWALLPGGKLLAVRTGGARSIAVLPASAADIRFTDMVKAGSLLVLAWEEQLFTEVGAAGILLYSVE